MVHRSDIENYNMFLVIYSEFLLLSFLLLLPMLLLLRKCKQSSIVKQSIQNGNSTDYQLNCEKTSKMFRIVRSNAIKFCIVYRVSFFRFVRKSLKVLLLKVLLAELDVLRLIMR